MDSGKAAQASPGSTKSSARWSVFSISKQFRSSGQKESDIDTPTCAERLNYEVYNPQNPKHNPSASKSFRREESHTSSSDSQKQSKWVHDLPRKSIHKARSGFLAIRGGLFQRRSRETTASSDDTSVERRKPSSVSTQEDLGFGVALYRTQLPWSPSGYESSLDVLMSTSSFYPLVNIGSAPDVLVSHHCRSFDDPDMLSGRDVSISLRRSFEKYSGVSGDGAFDLRLSKDMEARWNDEAAVDTTRKNLIVQKSHSSLSTDWDDFNACTTRLASNGGQGRRQRCLKRVSGSMSWDRTRQNPINEDSNVDINHSIHCRQAMSSSEDSTDQFQPLRMPERAQYRRDSAIVRDSSVMWSTFSDTSFQKMLSGMQSESFATQERLILEQETVSSVPAACSSTSLSEGSAECKFAFPGLHHALLDQWISDSNEEEYGESLMSGVGTNYTTAVNVQADVVPAVQRDTTSVSENFPPDNSPPPIRIPQFPTPVDPEYLPGSQKRFDSSRSLLVSVQPKQVILGADLERRPQGVPKNPATIGQSPNTFTHLTKPHSPTGTTNEQVSGNQLKMAFNPFHSSQASDEQYRDEYPQLRRQLTGESSDGYCEFTMLYLLNQQTTATPSFFSDNPGDGDRSEEEHPAGGSEASNSPRAGSPQSSTTACTDSTDSTLHSMVSPHETSFTSLSSFPWSPLNSPIDGDGPNDRREDRFEHEINELNLREMAQHLRIPNGSFRYLVEVAERFHAAIDELPSLNLLAFRAERFRRGIDELPSLVLFHEVAELFRSAIDELPSPRLLLEVAERFRIAVEQLGRRNFPRSQRLWPTIDFLCSLRELVDEADRLRTENRPRLVLADHRVGLHISSTEDRHVDTDEERRHRREEEALRRRQSDEFHYSGIVFD